MRVNEFKAEYEQIIEEIQKEARLMVSYFKRAGIKDIDDIVFEDSVRGYALKREVIKAFHKFSDKEYAEWEIQKDFDRLAEDLNEDKFQLKSHFALGFQHPNIPYPYGNITSSTDYDV